jgi:hypothetical protein
MFIGFLIVQRDYRRMPGSLCLPSQKMAHRKRAASPEALISLPARQQGALRLG